MATQATLIDPKTGKKVVVTSGSQQAQQYFGQGFILDTGIVSPAPGNVPTRTLEGTLNQPNLTMEQANNPVNWNNGKFVGAPTPQAPSLPERSLGIQKSPLQSYQDILKQMTRFTFDQGQKPADILQQFSQAGVPLTVPGVIGGAISSDTRSRAAQIGDIYTSTMQTIQDKQKQDAEYAQVVMDGIVKQAPSFLTSITKDEFDILRSGQTWTPEMQQKLQVAQQLASQEDTKFQFIPGTENQPSGTFDPSTGSFSSFMPSDPQSMDEGSVSFRTNNPGNIKWTGASWQTALGAVDSGIQATDGGSFAKFPNVEAGTEAQKQLLKSSGYADLTLDAAMKRWSNNGYGADVAPELDGNKKISQLSDPEFTYLLEQMKKREGFTAPSGQTGTEEQTLAQAIFNGTGSLSGISTKNNLRGKVSIELDKLKQDAMKSGDTVGMMRASAGGQNMDATAVTSLEKAVNVVNQLSELQNTIAKEATGPIWGIIRSNNPYDTKAQLIKAQLTAIVPNLARGIYGEVGVLTDNDVALYAKTLPNLKSTEEVSKFVLGATVRSVQRSIENKMLIQAGAGRDVSGLVNEFKKVKAVAEGLLTTENLNKPVASIDENMFRSALKGRKTADGSDLTEEEIKQLISDAKVLASQSKSPAEITAAINYALGY